MNTAAQRLRARATERFPTLTPAEERLLGCVADGEDAHYKSSHDDENDPQKVDTWGPNRTIHAKVLRWLCVDHVAIRHVHPKGLSIHEARIDGALDLRMITIPFPLFLVRCALREPMNLEFAEVRMLGLIGSTTQAIHGRGLVVHGDLRLQNGFEARGEVNLYNATIGGSLDCQGGRFLNKGERALEISGAKIDGAVFLHWGFQAQSRVRLINATIGRDLDCSRGVFHQEVNLGGITIGGNLNCENGQFLNKGGSALVAVGAKIGGTVFLQRGFQAEGEVNLINVNISGDLSCTGGQFLNKGGNALLADRAKIDGAVFLCQRFHAEGEVALISATIGGNLNCENGEFLNKGGSALTSASAKIGGTVFLRQRFQAEGLVRFPGAHIQGHLDCNGATFRGDTLNGLDGQAMIVGRVLDWRHVTTNQATILSLTGAKVGQLADDEASWPKSEDFSSKHLDLDGFTYDAILDGPTDAKTRIRCWLAQQTPCPLVPFIFSGIEQPEPPAQPFRPHPYQQLAKVLRERGQDTDAKRVLIAKEQERRKRGGLRWDARYWHGFLGLTMAYGYKPGRLLLVALFFVLLGWGLFVASYCSGQMIPTQAEAYKVYAKTGRVPAFYPPLIPWMYSLDTLLPIINFGQKDYWRPLEPNATSPIPQLSSLAPSAEAPSCLFFRAIIPAWVTSGRFLRVYRWVHIGVGWLLITLGIAGVTGLVRKE